MENLGERISKYRNQAGLTQKDLGDKLNVSAQAVSKWENGQSEPDIDTIKKMCELFGISIDVLISGEPEATEPEKEKEPEAEQAASAAAQPAVEQRIISGYCDECKRPVGPGEYTVTHRRGRGQIIYCNKCAAAMDTTRRIADEVDHEVATKRSFIWGSVAGVAALGIMLAITLTSLDTFSVGGAIALSIVFGFGYFAYIAQVFWDGAVTDVFFFFLKSFRMPGVIFTLDFEGLKFLIFAKILFLVLGAILSVLWFLLGVLIVVPAAALFTFPFALPRWLHEGKKLKADTAKAMEAEKNV